jgi:hypothetical protein
MITFRQAIPFAIIISLAAVVDIGPKDALTGAIYFIGFAAFMIIGFAYMFKFIEKNKRLTSKE